MKRIKYACLEQTIHFQLKEDIGREQAAELVKQEVGDYMRTLDKRNVKYNVRGETALPDGSIMLSIAKQYNSYDCGNYLDK